jgi:uncharacterized protein YjbI with pentapeptide repeats
MDMDSQSHCGKPLMSGVSLSKDGRYSGVCMFGQAIPSKDLSGVNFSGADLVRTEWLTRSMNLDKAIFENADLSHAKFTGANLRGTRFNGANLTNADFRGADLSNAEMRGCQMNGVNLEQARLDHTLMDSASFGGRICQDSDNFSDILKDIFRRILRRPRRIDDGKQKHDVARQIYRSLKLNFKEIGEYDSVSWAYFHERQMLRKMVAPWRAARYHPYEVNTKGRLKGSSTLKYFVRYLLWSLQSWSSGYGQKPLRALVLLLLIIPIFAFGYALSGGISADNRILTWQDYLLFSATAILRLNIGGMKITSDIAQLLLSAESVIGVGLYAIFANSLGQRVGDA